jgi:branched-subunit amino acid aminotransferase/4-amino-4-deoxychorismate lyase
MLKLHRILQRLPSPRWRNMLQELRQNGPFVLGPRAAGLEQQIIMTEPLAFLNGGLIPQAQASLALNDAGFVFGATVTDLCRTFRHRLYRWPDHRARFRRSCAAAFLDVPLDDAAITLKAEELIAHNGALIDAHSDLALVLFATPGPIGYYLGQASAAGAQPTFGMHTFPLPCARYRPWIADGIALATPDVCAVPAVCVDPHIKQRSRMHWWLAEQEVRRTHPGAQALLLDLDGNVTETASANFLLVRNNTIISPPRDRILDGISLGVVSELAAGLGIPMAYRPITLEECHEADEALLTCTTYCLAGVRQINERALAWPGPMLRRLLAAWNTAVGLDIHQQILTG